MGAARKSKQFPLDDATKATFAEEAMIQFYSKTRVGAGWTCWEKEFKAEKKNVLRNQGLKWWVIREDANSWVFLRCGVAHGGQQEIKPVSRWDYHDEWSCMSYKGTDLWGKALMSFR